ncbi:MAG: hypothetical protein KI793_24360 [Rivularia sp. (in: Bacteria)]|nr:hypothetical protein [Rivularia sp. MS3]
MSNSKSFSSVSRKNKQSRRNNRIYRSLLMTFVIAGSNLLSALPLLAETPGTVINNQATGSFTDPANNNNEVLIESNIVKVTIAEVAGITVTPDGTEEAPAGVNGAGEFQGNGKINPEDVVYFQYKITNVGNDPTKFFIPGAPSGVTNGALNGTGTIEVIGYDPDGNNQTSITPEAIPATGAETGTITGLPNNGSIAPGGSITIRVPIKVDTGLQDGDKVTVIMGDTPPNDNSSDTQNQDYSDNGNNGDIYTVDNNGTENGDSDGDPVNGVREASANQDVTVTNANSISGTLYEDDGGADTGNDTFDNGETKLPENITVNLYEDTNGNDVLDPGENTPVQTVETDANGDYIFPDVADGDYIVKVDETDTDIPEYYTPGTVEDLPVTVNGASEADKDFGFDKNAPDVIMVKRITKINGQTVNPNDSKPLGSFVDDPSDDNDTSANWPTGYVVGEIDAGRVRVGDEIEYTIYFLNAGKFKAENLRICDAIQGQQDLKADAYGAGNDLQLNVSNNGDTNLTSASGDDRAEFIAANGTVPANCNLQVPNDNGTLVVDVTDATLTEIPGSTAPGTANSYGLIRFTTVVRDDNP